MAASAWPATLSHGHVTLRPLRRRDRREWVELRSRNVDWLQPWEATPPVPDAEVMTFRQMVRDGNARARAGTAFPWAVVVRGYLAGQVTVSGVTWGSSRSGHLGYWLGEDFAGQGHMPISVAMAIDHCLFRVGLHRLEINIRPENAASLRVVEKLSLRFEGRRSRLLHIDGDWRDHLSFAVTREEAGGGIITRLQGPAAAIS